MDDVFHDLFGVSSLFLSLVLQPRMYRKQVLVKRKNRNGVFALVPKNNSDVQGAALDREASKERSGVAHV